MSSITFPRRRFAAFAVAGAVATVATVVPLASPSADAVRATAVVLDVRLTGGFAPAYTDFRAVPVHVVTDRQHFTPMATTAEFPGPMLAPFEVSPVTRSTLRQIDKLAEAAGLRGKVVDWGLPPTADVPELRVTYRGRVQSIASWGVGEELLTPKQREARRKVAALLGSLPTKAGTTFKPVRVVLAVQLADPSAVPNGSPAPEVKDWPTAAEDISSSGGCMMITSPSGIAALTVAKSTTQFRRSAKTWQVYARPLLPGDRGCGP
jgi:hypothetical protein